MEMFQFTVEHRPGKSHSNADALSHKPDIESADKLNPSNNEWPKGDKQIM